MFFPLEIIFPLNSTEIIWISRFEIYWFFFCQTREHALSFWVVEIRYSLRLFAAVFFLVIAIDVLIRSCKNISQNDQKVSIWIWTSIELKKIFPFESGKIMAARRWSSNPPIQTVQRMNNPLPVFAKLRVSHEMKWSVEWVISQRMLAFSFPRLPAVCNHIDCFLFQCSYLWTEAVQDVSAVHVFHPAVWNPQLRG